MTLRTWVNESGEPVSVSWCVNPDHYRRLESPPNGGVERRSGPVGHPPGSVGKSWTVQPGAQLVWDDDDVNAPDISAAFAATLEV